MFKRHRKKEGGSTIKSLIRTFIINAFALYLLSQNIPGFSLNEGLRTLFIISVAFTLLRVILKPLLETLLGSINFLTFGLLGVAIDAGILYALSRFFPQITLSPWYFPGAETHGFTLPPYNFTEITTIGLIAFLINLLHTIIELLV